MAGFRMLIVSRLNYRENADDADAVLCRYADFLVRSDEPLRIGGDWIGVIVSSEDVLPDLRLHTLRLLATRYATRRGIQQ